MSAGRILVVCGLRFEAALARGSGIEVVVGGGSRRALAARLTSIDPAHVAAVVSFGLAGALDLSLAAGDLIIPVGIVGPEASSYRTAAAMRASWTRLAAFSGVRELTLLGVDEPIMTAERRAELRAATGAAAVDMESHLAAEYAERHGLPFGALRAISDPAARSLPPVAGDAMRPDGSIAMRQLLAGLARDPGQLLPLMATARDATVAFGRLRRVCRLLGPRLGLHL